jgi:hypothetical protein
LHFTLDLPEGIYYLSEDTTHAVVIFREMVSINYLNLIQIVGAIFKKITILCLGHLASTYYG